MSSALGGGVASSSSATRARSPRAEGVPELADGGASRGQEPGHVPEAITDGVVERGADRAARRVESRADVDEDDGHVNVAARCPVQRGLRLRAAGPCVGIGPGVDQQPRPRRGRSGSSRASRWRCAAGCASCPGGGPRSRSRRWWRALAPPVGSARSHPTPPTGGPDAHLCLDRSLPNVRLRRAARPARHRAHRPAGSRGRRRSARRVCRQLRQGGCSTGSAVTTCRWPPGSPR